MQIRRSITFAAAVIKHQYTHMKVKELIEELQKCNPDAKVVAQNKYVKGEVEFIKNINPANSVQYVSLECK